MANKLSKDQKNLLKSSMIYSIVIIVSYPLFRWIFSGDVSWEDFWMGVFTSIAVAIASLLLLLGSKRPNSGKDKQ